MAVDMSRIRDYGVVRGPSAVLNNAPVTRKKKKPKFVREDSQQRTMATSRQRTMEVSSPEVERRVARRRTKGRLGAMLSGTLG
jgi:hypothetical protein